MTLALFGLAMPGCKERDLGTGMNTMDREFPKPMADVWEAAIASVKQNNLTIDSQTHDALGGEIIARRANTDPVTVRVKVVDKHHTSVSVRVGQGDRRLAELILEQIEAKLQL